MKFKHRILYYGIGLFFGILFVNFVWGNKKTEFCYFPNCRVLKNIRLKKMNLVQQQKFDTNTFAIDTTAIKDMLRNGTVDFPPIKTDVDSCKLYKINGRYLEKEYTLMIQNCDSTMVIQDIIKN